MLEILRKAVQTALIWLLLFINGGKLPPELMPKIDIPEIDWSSLFGQADQWQVKMPAPLDGLDLAAARKTGLRPQALPAAAQPLSETDLLPVSAGSFGALPSGNTALLGALAGGVGGSAAGLDPSARIVNPSGVPRELLGVAYPWRAKNNSRRPGTSAVATEIVEEAPVEGRGAALGLVLLGAGALAVAGYVVVRRRR